MVSDALLILIGFVIAYFVRYELQWFRAVEPAFDVDFSAYVPSMFAISASCSPFSSVTSIRTGPAAVGSRKSTPSAWRSWPAPRCSSSSTSSSASTCSAVCSFSTPQSS
ncbi:MAG: hypothetical protein R3A10_04200 [Caldilineaceae bacterium]